MGGNLFNAPRINNQDYENLIEFFSKEFKSINIDILIPRSFKNKETHGDLDIIVQGDTLSTEQLMEMFELKKDQVSRNSSTISILYKGQYQVDLCFHPEERFQSAYDYNRNSDSGNIIGRIANALGFKYGHKGLIYPVKLGSCEVLGEVLISQDTQKIITFLGFDYDQWNAGFYDEQELFQWLINSKYFNPHIFKYETLNHINRVRNKKRPVYASLVKYLETLHNDEKQYYKCSNNKSEYLWNALIVFDNISVMSEIEKLIQTAKFKKKANAFFNGSLVMEETGLTGIELGEVIKTFQVQVEEKFNTKSLGLSWTQFIMWYEDNTFADEHVMDLFIRWYDEVYQKSV